MLVDDLFNCVKEQGQMTDRELMSWFKLSLDDIHALISQLTAEKRLYSCDYTLYKDGNEVKGVMCRISGYVPSGYNGKKSITPAKR